MFTNEKIINAERKMSKEILISVFIIVAAFISFYVSFLFDEKDKKNEKDHCTASGSCNGSRSVRLRLQLQYSRRRYPRHGHLR